MKLFLPVLTLGLLLTGCQTTQAPTETWNPEQYDEEIRLDAPDTPAQSTHFSNVATNYFAGVNPEDAVTLEQFHGGDLITSNRDSVFRIARPTKQPGPEVRFWIPFLTGALVYGLLEFVRGIWREWRTRRWHIHQGGP